MRANLSSVKLPRSIMQLRLDYDDIAPSLASYQVNLSMWSESRNQHYGTQIESQIVVESWIPDCQYFFKGDGCEALA